MHPTSVINGRYQLQTKLGAGGMGIVYRATDRLTGETVALKQVHLSENLQVHDSLAPGASEDDLRLALAHEFQILAGLRHPHIISVLDYGFDDEKRPFFTMTHLPETENILDAAQDAPFDRKIELIQQLLQALAYLHRRGVLHRDLKPDNVLVNDGNVRVLDFGLSANDKLGNDSVGTPLYMAPELFGGQNYSPAADLYAVGVIFYQMLTGTHPFEPFDFTFLSRVLEKTPNFEGVNEAIRPFLNKLLAKTTNDRFSTASDALLALAEVLGHPAPPETAAIRESYLQAANFVGREAEMAQLTDALVTTAAGSGSAWLIGGESGVGKTRLINELHTQALVSGFQVLRGQATEDGGQPYQVWRDPLRQLVIALPDIDNLTAGVLLPLVPDMPQLLNRAIDPAPALEEDAAQARLLTTIARLFRMAERPFLLILEDLHLANVSLLPIPYLARTVTQLPLLILGSYRSDERPSLPPTLPDMTHLLLPRLTPQAMSDLSAAMLGNAGRNEAVQALLQRETEGNAFFAVEVVRALAEEAGHLGNIGQMKLPDTLLPNGIQDVVQRRVERLPEEARDLLVKTAVAGRTLELPLIQQLANGIDVENEWLPLCADAAVLDVQNGVWQFSHGKIRDGLYANLSSAQQVQLHQEVAQAIEKCCPDDQKQAGRLAYHWHRAQNPQKEQLYAWQAGQTAAEQFAHVDAITYFNQALAATPPNEIARQLEILLALEKAYDLTGQREEGQAALAQLTELANALANPQQQMTVMLRQVDLASNLGRFADADQLAEQAIIFAQTHDLRQQLVLAHVLRARALLIQGLPEMCEAELQQAQTANQNIQDTKLELNILTIYRNLLEFQGNHQAALELAEQRLQRSREVGLKLQEAKSLMTLGLAHDKLHQYQQAKQFLEESLELLVALGDRYSEGVCLLNLGNLFIRYGDYAAAQEILHTCLQVSRDVNDQMNEGIVLYNLGVIAVWQGRYADAMSHVSASYAISQQISDREGDAYALTQLGKIHRLQGEYDEAQRCYQLALSLRQEMNQPHFFAENQIGLALLEIATGQDPQQNIDAVLAVVRADPIIAGVDSPFEIYQDLIEALMQQNHPDLSAILLQAHYLLQKQAAQFEDDLMRQSFLENIPAHRQLVEWISGQSFLNETINGRYQLTQKLGAGGMGIVYRATDRLTGETVALKQVTTPEKLHVSMTQSLALTPSQLRLALAQEFQTLTGLRHPHIISVLDYGFDAGQQPFFTMDYLPAAETILAAGQAQPVARRIELLQQLLQALAYLHRRGVLHRDLKPGNVLVCSGAVKVLDFGLAASTRSGSSLSGGTPLYLAPEVWEATAYTPAADLWAVGVMGVELLAGQHPFGPLDGDLTSRVLDDAPDLAGVPEAVRPVLARLLDKDPVARYGRAADVLAELAAALGQEAPAETTAIRESYLQAATFVGREAEMAQLEAALLGALAGRGSAWLIGGESGVGKTRLLDELRTRALVQGFQVLRGQMREDGSLPYEAWREPVRHLAATLPEMDALAASVLLPLVPDIGELVGSTVSPAPELEGAAAQTRLFTTVATLLRQANRPLLILMEDLQWAKESLYPIPFITRTIKDQPVVLIGSYRNDEQPALPERLPDMQLLSLPRLTTHEMAELSRAMLGEIGQQENVLTLIQQETEGNAFFAVEVVRALAEDVGKLRAIGQRPLPEQLLPGGIQAIIERRLERIPAAAWPLLQLAAVAGRELDLKLVEAFAGAVDVPAWWLPLCSNAAVLEVRNGRWQFSHDKIRRSVLMALPAAARAAHHGQIAEAITAVYPDSPEMAAPIAHHWQAAGNNEQERHYRLAAANYAQEQFAYDDLLAQLDRALILTADSDLAAQFDILAKKVKALYFLGKTEQEENAAKQLISLAEKTHDAEKIVVAHTARVQSLITKGDLDTANRIAQDTMDRFVDQPVDSLTGLFPVWAMCAIMQGNYDHALSILDEAQAVLNGRNTFTEVAIRMHRGTIAYRVGKYQEAIQSHTAALTLAQELGSQNQLISALNNLASSHLENQEVEKAVEYYEQAFQLNRRVGNQIFHISLLINMGICHALLHDYALSQSLTKQAMTLAETVGNQINVAIAAESLGHTACLLGHFAEGLQYAQFGLGILEKIAKSNAYLMGDIWQVMAENLFYLNRLDEAEEAHQAALTYRSEGAIERRIQTEAGLAHTVLAKGEPERALTYLQSVLTFLESSDAPNFSHLFLYLVCYDVLNGNGLPEAEPYLQTAYRLLQAEAEKIAPDESRKIFWETHVVHREIVRLYEALPVGKETADFSFGTTADVAANDAAARAAEAILDEALKGAVETAEPALERLRGEALLTRLLAVSRRMAETRTVQPLLSYAIDEVLQLVGAERGYIVLLRPDGALDYRVRRRRDGSEIRSGDPVSYSILNEVIRTRQPLVVRNALLDPRFGAAHSVVAMRLRSVMCAPLITKDAIIGAIYVENRSRSGRFSEEDLAPLAFFSNQAAVAIENANLNENLESLVEERTRELAQAKEVAEIANLAKTTFLSNMSHELRTPLNAVLNFAGFVMDGFFGDVNTEQENALQQVLDSGEHLLSLINDVLDLNKIEAGMMNLVFEEVDLAKIMQHLLSTGKGLVKDKPIVITADLAADLPLIQADRRRLRQIFLNLMSNAAKYTLEGTIHVQAHRLAQMVEVSIQDSGIGIAPEDYPLIFQTYRQARRNPDNVMSTGLGLPITRQLVELHGGRIWFESKSGVGTTFYVQMPIKRGE